MSKQMNIKQAKQIVHNLVFQRENNAVVSLTLQDARAMDTLLGALSDEIWVRRFVGKTAFAFGVALGFVAGFTLAWHVVLP
jgi:hypothetical protein